MKAWFDLPGNYRWLLIFDNVDNPKIPNNTDPGAYDIRSYFSENYRGSILVTTRWKALSIGDFIEVAKLSEIEDGMSLLEKTSGKNSGQGLHVGYESEGWRGSARKCYWCENGLGDGFFVV